MQTTENNNNITTSKRSNRVILLVVFVVLTAMASLAFVTSYIVIMASAHSRYMGIKNVTTEKIAKIVRGAEMNANNIFDEVSRHLDNPDDVIAALKSKASLNLDVRGYFAAFVPDYFPEKGTWFEPYIFQPEYGGYDYRQVGSARHNYTKSPWFVQAKETGASFWSEPYYYYDGTSISGHYSTFVKPLYNSKGDLACVCGADMKFEWLAKELKWVDESSRVNKLMNKYLLNDLNFYTIILNNDGTCIAHPEEKEMAITDEATLKDLQHGKSGVTEMDIDGKACVVYYGPIEYINWSVAVIVPKQDILIPLMVIAGVLLSMIVVGMLIIWSVCRR
jgi:hypothetical protein